MKEEIEKITLDTPQATVIMDEILKDFEELAKGNEYAAPELIQLQLHSFLWRLYVRGRVDEKNDILKLFETK